MGRLTRWWPLAAIALFMGVGGYLSLSGGTLSGNVYGPNLINNTTQALTLYVDKGGADTNACTTPGTGACLTIQGALNRAPKVLRHGVTISIDAGSYPCFYVSGFTCDPSRQQSTGGLLIDGLGSFVTFPYTDGGTAAGTATAGTAGSATVYGTMTDSAQVWATDEHQGRFLVLTSGTGAGQQRVISRNTGTVLTITGAWSTAPASGTGYAIQDPGVIINTACSSPPLPLTAAGANNSAILFLNNDCPARRQSLVVRGVRTSNTSGTSISVSDLGNEFIVLSQLRNSNASASAIQVGIAANTASAVDMQDVTIAGNSSATAISLGSGLFVPNRVQVIGGSVGMGVAGTGLSTVASVTALESINSVTPVSVTGGRIAAMSQSQFTCSAGTGTAVVLGTSGATSITAPQYANAQISGASVTTCGTGLVANGPTSSAELTGLTGAAGTTGILAQSGGFVAFTSGTTITGATQDLSVDGVVTGTISSLASGACYTNAATGSRACFR